jgi:hypothetical protein
MELWWLWSGICVKGITAPSRCGPHPRRSEDSGSSYLAGHPNRLGHEWLDVTLAYLNGKDSESEEAQKHPVVNLPRKRNRVLRN